MLNANAVHGSKALAIAIVCYRHTSSVHCIVRPTKSYTIPLCPNVENRRFIAIAHFFFLQKSSLSWFLQSMSVYRVIFFSLIPRYGYFTPRNHLFNQMNTDFMHWNSWPLLSYKKWALGGVSNPFKCHKSRRINLVAVIICFSSNVRKIEWCSFEFTSNDFTMEFI